MRRFLWLSLGALLLAGMAVASSGGATQAEARWVVISLGTLGGKEGQANAINNKGQVVGSAEVRVGVQHAFLWQKGRMVDLGTFGGAEGWAADINERSQVVGLAATKAKDAEGEQVAHGFIWQNAHTTDLGAFSPAAINDRGQIAGWSRNEPSIWREGRVTGLGGLPSASSCFPNDINERAQIVGVCFADEMSHLHAVLWQGGTARDLGSLGSAGATDVVIAINEQGQIVGARNGRAFVWEKGKYRYLPTPKGKRTQAAGINEQGQVAGWLLGDSIRAAVWQNGRMTLLPNLPGTSDSYAVAINDRHEIVGWSFEGGGARHAVLWTLKR